MTAPLSMQFDSSANEALGMFNGPLGLYGNQGTAKRFEQDMARRFARPLGELGYSGAGFYYTAMPAMISGVSGYGGVSTQTGVPVAATDPAGAQGGTADASDTTASSATGSGGIPPA